MGLKTKRLNTYELIEVFYKSYNPDLTESQKLKDLSGIDVAIDENKKDNA